MRNLIKAILSFSWAGVLLGIDKSLESVIPGNSRRSDEGSSVAPAGSSPVAAQSNTQSSPAIPVTTSQKQGAGNSGRLCTSSFVVLGEGLAAGMGDFSLSDASQKFSFPAQMARQMSIPFVQPLFEPPGIGETIGFAPWSVVVPSPLQSTVVDKIPPYPPDNLSVPGFKVSDALRTRPQEPLIDQNNAKQTSLNLILGLRGIAYGAQGPLPTQLEMAVQRRPTFALVALGYTEALDAAVNASPGRIPDRDSFREDYSKIVRGLRTAGADLLLLTIPDPLDTAYFSTLQTAAEIVKLDPQMLAEFWGLPEDGLITVNGLNEISFQLYAASIGPLSRDAIRPLPSDAILSADIATELRSRVKNLNQEIAGIAAAEGAIVYDLNSLFRRIHDNDLTIGGQTIAGDYLGGFYSLNGYYPGATGHALITNEILDLINGTFEASFPLIDLAKVIPLDQVAAYKKAGGRNWTREEISSPAPLSLPAPTASPSQAQGPPPSASGQVVEKTFHSLRLPPNLEQVLPLNSQTSYFGDALIAQNCVTPETIRWGSGGNLFFGGLALMNSHLSGNIRIRFSPPVGDWTTFQVSFEKELVGSDSVLAAPTFFKMPGRQQLVGNVPGKISSGRLNLQTGQVDFTTGNLNIYVSFFNSALFALLCVNPNFPTTPLSFPGAYGSANVQFEQRSDGNLDFTFSGSTFVPLGNGTSFPLNFCGPSRQFASIPANGTVLHPHLALSTKEAPVIETGECPTIPFNTVQEFTLFTPVSSFGDLFGLDAPQFGGPALGRSRLLGRIQIQFGPSSGPSVPVAVSTTTAGGVLAPLDPTPIAQLFPGRLTPGPQGIYENLRFPLRTYSLNDLSVIDDPFDLSVGALDLRTGEWLQPLLHRGFINQDLIFALLRVEPRTPKDSFFFRGPSRLLKDSQVGLVLSYFGEVRIPYPPGFFFPDPNLATGLPVTGGGALDPYLWLLAFRDGVARNVVRSGKGENLLSSRGDAFSYRFVIPDEPTEHQAVFEYENLTQQGRFRMHSLAWINLANPTVEGKTFETVTFSCFGIWMKDGIERVVQGAAQFASSDEISYVGIQIGTGGEISNVNVVFPLTVFAVPITHG